MADQASFTEKRSARVFAKRRHLQHQLTSPLPSPSPTGNISTKVLHAFKSQPTPQSASSLNSSTRSNSLNSSILSTLKPLDTSHYPLAETLTPPAMKALSFDNDVLWAPSDMIEPLVMNFSLLFSHFMRIIYSCETYLLATSTHDQHLAFIRR